MPAVVRCGFGGTNGARAEAAASRFVPKLGASEEDAVRRAAPITALKDPQDPPDPLGAQEAQGTPGRLVVALAHMPASEET